MSDYNLHTIRELLGEAFSSGEITTLAFDLFHDIYQDFTAGMTRSTKIEMVVANANKKGRIPDLLKYVQEKNAYQYGRYANKLKSPSPSQEAQPTSQTTTSPASSTQEPTFGIITALPKEMAAMRVMLDNVKPVDKISRKRPQRYYVGHIPASSGGQHTIALALMLDMGTNSAAALATRLLNDFPSIQDVIMVGIAGGVPSPGKVDDHVRLGDVVISDRNGIVQYDYVKEEIKERKERHPPRPPRANLLNAVNLLEVDALMGDKPWLPHFERATNLNNAARPPESEDILYNFTDPDNPVPIPHPFDRKRGADQPRIFKGAIASASILQKNPRIRDELGNKHGVKAIEMEGSGIANATWEMDSGYLVIRGICDYCDPAKNDIWQEYAAVAASAYTRALLESVPNISS